MAFVLQTSVTDRGSEGLCHTSFQLKPKQFKRSVPGLCIAPSMVAPWLALVIIWFLLICSLLRLSNRDSNREPCKENHILGLNKC